MKIIDLKRSNVPIISIKLNHQEAQELYNDLSKRNCDEYSAINTTEKIFRALYDRGYRSSTQ